jgi:hypothetical protein
MARTAVISGTATAVSNRVSRRQAQRWSGQNVQPYQPEYDSVYGQPAAAVQPPPPPPVAAAPPPATGDVITQLKELGQLHEQGVLTDEEFAVQKHKILGG